MPNDDYSYEANRTLFMSLIRPIRDGDFDQGRDFLKRYLSRMEFNADQTKTRIQSLEQTDNFATVQDALVKFLKSHVGFTSELDNITNRLSTATLKKLCSGAVALWKRRGTPVSLVNMIRLLTGRSVTYRDWFYYRVLIGDSAAPDPNSMILGEEQSGFDINLGGGSVSVFDEFYSQIRMMDPGIPSFGSAGTDAQLLLDIANLCRPVSERIEIALLDFWDTFADGSLSRWQPNLGLNASVANGIATVPPGAGGAPNLRQIRFDGAGLPIWDDYTEYVVGMKIKFSGTGPVSFTLLQDNLGSIQVAIQATLDGRGGTISIPHVIDFANGEDGGAFGAFGTIIKFGVWYTFRIWVRGGDGAGNFGVRCTLDGNLLCEVYANLNSFIVDPSDAPRHGTWSFFNASGGDVQITNVETWRTPRMRFATIGPSGYSYTDNYLTG